MIVHLRQQEPSEGVGGDDLEAGAGVGIGEGLGEG